MHGAGSSAPHCTPAVVDEPICLKITDGDCHTHATDPSMCKMNICVARNSSDWARSCTMNSHRARRGPMGWKRVGTGQRLLVQPNHQTALQQLLQRRHLGRVLHQRLGLDAPASPRATTARQGVLATPSISSDPSIASRLAMPTSSGGQLSLSITKEITAVRGK